MRCPNRQCRQKTDRLVSKCDREGKVITGCPSCIHRGKHEHVYTGRKLWTGDEVYGREKCKEKNHEFERTLLERAAKRNRGGFR